MATMINASQSIMASAFSASAKVSPSIQTHASLLIPRKGLLCYQPLSQAKCAVIPSGPFSHGDRRARRLFTVRAESGGDEDGKSRVSVEDREKEKEKLEEYRKFKANPSIEASIQLEKKLAEQKLAQLEAESQDNPGFFRGLLSSAVKSTVQREKARLERAEGKFKALDLEKLRTCFSFDTFFATGVRRFGDGGIFIGNLRRPLADVKPILEKKLQETAGREVDVWFMQEESPDGPKQVCVVQPKEEIDLQIARSDNWVSYLTALLLGAATLGTVGLLSGFFLTPDASVGDFISREVPLLAGFLTIFIVSETATRLTAAHYGVKLSPTLLIPSSWTGSLGAVNDFESLLPNRNALFDIAAARTTSAYVTSLLLAAVAFALDKDFGGGDNALYITPLFFVNNPLLSFVQYVIGPYSDELGNVLPQAVPGKGVPLDPLAFAGLLGMVVTALNLLPIGRLEGGRIAQAMIGRSRAKFLSLGTSLTLGLGGLSGSVLSLAWAFYSTLFRSGEELPAKDEISPLDTSRVVWGAALAVFCLLTLFPNSAGVFPSVFYTPPFWRSEL